MEIKQQIKALLVAGTVCALFLAALSGFVIYALNEAKQAQAWATHSNQVTESLSRLKTAFDHSENVGRDFITYGNSASDLAQFRRAVEAETSAAWDLTESNQAQRQHLTEFGEAVRKRWDSVDKLIELRQTAGVEAMQAYVRDRNTLADTRRVTDVLDFAARREAEHRASRTTAANNALAVVYIVLLGLIAALFVALALFFYVTYKTLNDRILAARNLRRENERMRREFVSFEQSRQALDKLLERAAQVMEAKPEHSHGN